MLRRFVAGTAVAAVVIATGAFVILVVPALRIQNLYPVTMMWCFVPLIWGIWAMLAPQRWIPQRLPMWGSLLGLIAGLVAMFIVNIPARLLGSSVAGLTMSAKVPVAARIIAAVLAAAFYYVLWMFVRAVYRSIDKAHQSAESFAAAGGK